MQRHLRNFLVTIVVVLAIGILVGSVQPVFGQPNGGGNPCPGGLPCNPDVPITGIEFLLAGGAMLGLKEIVRKFRSNEKQD
jgi:hypothetical protein